MFLLNCPNCGSRNVSEFRYGGEVVERPDPNTAAIARWSEYLYMRDNPLGIVCEWWYHHAGCGQWFVAERHTKTHQIAKTYVKSPGAQKSS